MANVLQLTATLMAGPQGSSDCSFPSGVSTVSFGLLPSTKSAGVSTGLHNKSVNSASSFVALDGIGSAETVTQGNTLYLRTTTAMQIRLTMQPASGPDVVSIVYVQGAMLLELPSTNYLKLLEAQGVGTVEYLVSGNL